MFCSNCGKGELSESAIQCPQCGEPLGDSQFSTRVFGDKSKVVFVLLALFLGAFGIHRFYLGNVFLGLLYLCFCWTGVPMIVALVEAIVIGLRENDERFNT